MRKTIVLDANLLVLLIVGLAGRKYISMHKRLREYREADFELLSKLIAESAGVVVTPNALTEASNLLRQINEPARSEIGRAFHVFTSKAREIYVRSADASSRSEFLRLGLSDSALLEVSKDDIVILSADLDLYLAALTADYTAVNFNHERAASLME